MPECVMKLPRLLYSFLGYTCDTGTVEYYYSYGGSDCGGPWGESIVDHMFDCFMKTSMATELGGSFMLWNT